MKMRTRALTLLGAAAMMAVGAMAPAAAEENPPNFPQFVDLTKQTEADNAVHYQQVSASTVQAITSPGNISCRADKPAFVSQPEFDGRVTVKGEDTAATTIECVDLMMQAQETMSGTLYIEWYKPGYGWLLIEPTRTPVAGRMAKGVGTAVGAVDYIFPANDPSQGHTHRACIKLDAPTPIAQPLCQTFAPIGTVNT